MGTWPSYCYDPSAGTLKTVSDGTACPSTSDVYVGYQAQVDAAADIGATTSRLGAPWSRFEPNAPVDGNHTYTFDSGGLTARYERMTASGIDPFILVTSAPSWAWPDWATSNCPKPDGSGNFPSCEHPPDSSHYGDFRAYLEALMTKYPQMKGLEIWNEENSAKSFYAHPTPTADACAPDGSTPITDPCIYGDLIHLARQAAQATGFQGSLVLGGLAPQNSSSLVNNGGLAPTDFLQGTYTYQQSNGTGQLFDAIGAHPYPKLPAADGTWSTTMLDQVSALRDVRDRNGDGSPFWLTEVGVGAPADGFKDGHVSLDEQGPVLAQLYNAAAAQPDVSVLTFYSLREIPGDPYWAGYGVLYPDLTQKPAYCYLGTSIGRPCTATAAPTFTATDPASPANDNSPQVEGSAAAGTTVKLYTTSDCSGAPVASGTADAFASSGISVSVADDSTTTLHATATDGHGNASACSADSITYVEDSTAPSGGQITSALPIFGLTTPFTVAWGGASDPSGIKSYQAYVHAAPYNAGFASPALLSTTPGPGSASVQGAPGNTYCSYVIASDNAGNTSGPSAEKCTALPVDDPGLTGSGWTRSTGQAGYYQGTSSSSSTKGAILSVTGVRAKRISLVATKCPTCGRVQVLQGGKSLATVNLAANSLQTEQVITVANFTAVKTGTVTLKVTTSGKPVIVDGLGVSAT